MAEPKERDWKRIALVTVPAIVLAGLASGWLSNSGYGNSWFDSLDKPFFMPPGWVFPLAWTSLYALLGVALALVLAAPSSDRRRRGLLLFYVQLALNFAWSPIFFAGHDIRLALFIIVAMIGIAAAAGQFRRIEPLAGWMMLPYLAWLCFAAALNNAVDRLNPGAGTPLLG